MSKWRLERDGITCSALQTFMACPERFRLSYDQGLTSGRLSDAILFGNITHAALEQAYTLVKDMKRPRLRETLDMLPGILEKIEAEEQRRISLSILGSDEEKQLDYCMGLAEAVLPRYFKFWDQDLGKLEWISLEEEFETDYQGLKLRGKRDGVFRQEGKLWLFETKTKSRIEEEAITEILPFDLQVMMYMLSIREQYGDRPIGVCYNIIRRPGQRIKQGETPKAFHSRVTADIDQRPHHYFIRYDCIVTGKEFQRWEEEFQDMLKQLVLWNDGAYHFRRSAECNNKYGRCEFLRLCSREDSSNLREKDSIFPELSYDG